MQQYTLLEIVQHILAETNGDSVNSISDTVESQDVATIVKRVFDEIVTEYDVPAHKDLISLTGLGDNTRPNIMQIPSTVGQLEWIQYNVQTLTDPNKRYRTIDYKDPFEFVTFVNMRPSSDTTNHIVVQYTANAPLIILKKAGPTYWTSFDDEYIIFDSYDSDVESSLQSYKSLAMAISPPALIVDDSTVPDLPGNLNSLLYTESLSRTFASTKGQINPKVERSESRMRVRASRNKWRQGRMKDDGPDYGRK